MSKSLVIVESPAKAKTIARYLGDQFEVKASVGHIMDLPKKKLGVDVEKDFQVVYEVIPGKEKVIAELRRAAAKAECIYLAADPDREGEAICRQLYDEVARQAKNVFRVMFHEITKDAIREAFHTPGRINEDLVKAQNTRRILDRLVGYKVSPLLWKKVRQGLSAGRVQTVALRLIVDREKEIRAFVSEEYWNFIAHLAAPGPPVFRAKAIKLDGKKFSVTNGEQAAILRQELENAAYVVESVKKSVRRQQPSPPYTTSKFQQEANRRYKMTASKAMQIAQRLYEGVEIGAEGSTGLITYMRTDSTRVAPAALDAVRQYIGTAYGDEYLPPKARFFQKSGTAQDAHEAIRPTDVNRTPAMMKAFLTPEQFKIYSLIWQRFVASQMEAARFDHTDVKIQAGRCQFQAAGDVLKFAGFLKVYKETLLEEDEVEEEAPGLLPEMKEKDVLKLKKLDTEQQFTQPPPRYSEATLIKALEEKGIGRPSTYATIVSIIQNREYSVKEEGRFKPTETGEIVVDLLVESFPDLFDYQYTANMESQLDLIEQGQSSWLEELRRFYRAFSESLKQADTHMRNLKAEVVPTDEVCPDCGSAMVIRWGRFGKFLSCQRYPECKNSRDLQPRAGTGAAAAETAEGPEATCEKCGSKMVLKKGRFGSFLACSGYPACKNTRKLTRDQQPAEPEQLLEEKCPQCGKPLASKKSRFGRFVACSGYPGCKFIKRDTLEMTCPNPGCGGQVIARRGMRGRTFYGCSRYPACSFTSWQKPVERVCPACGNPFLTERETKKEGRFLQCPVKTCNHKLPPEPETPPAKS